MDQEQEDAAYQWLQANAIDIQSSEVAIAPVQVTDHAWFNCETGLMSISTEIYPPCLECELPSLCVHFPRENVLSCMTGDGDGDYGRCWLMSFAGSIKWLVRPCPRPPVAGCGAAGVGIVAWLVFC